MLGAPYMTTDPLGNKQYYIYDSATGRYQMTYINGVVSTQNNYNSRGLLASVTRAGYYDDDGVSTRATQDYFFRLKSPVARILCTAETFVTMRVLQKNPLWKRSERSRLFCVCQSPLPPTITPNQNSKGSESPRREVLAALFILLIAVSFTAADRPDILPCD